MVATLAKAPRSRQSLALVVPRVLSPYRAGWPARECAMDRRTVLKTMLAVSAAPDLLASRSEAQLCGSQCASIVSVMQFGAKGDGVHDDLPAFKAAHDALGAAGGVLTGLQRTYRFAGTLTISNPVTIDFFNTTVTYEDGHGAILRSKENAPILEYAGVGSRFVGLRNINVVGVNDGSARSQDGVVVNNGATVPRLRAGGIRMSNVSIFHTGRYGLYVKNSYAGNYENLYAGGCGDSGVLIDVHCGGNLWSGISTVENGSVGFNVLSADGSDTVIGLVSEQNPYGIVLGPGVSGWEFIGTHTEANSKTPLLFKERSDRNRVGFTSRGGGGEPTPANHGGQRNSWSGGEP